MKKKPEIVNYTLYVLRSNNFCFMLFYWSKMFYTAKGFRVISSYV